MPSWSGNPRSTISMSNWPSTASRSAVLPSAAASTWYPASSSERLQETLYIEFVFNEQKSHEKILVHLQLDAVRVSSHGICPTGHRSVPMPAT